MGAAIRLNNRAGVGRWHPYPIARTNISTSHQTTQPQPSQTHSIDTFNGATIHTLLQKERFIEAKRAQKDKFENALKDFSVKRLADIWRETAYVSNSANARQFGTTAMLATGPTVAQAPPIVKMETYLSPPLSPSPFAFQAPVAAAPVPSRGMPLRPFVHDVLRRSKTGWPALQVALCYLDAVREKVSEAILEAQKGENLPAAEAALDLLFTYNHVEPAVEATRPSTSNPALATSCTSFPQVGQTVTPPSSDACGSCPSIPAALSSDSTNDAPKRGPRRRRIPPVPAEPLPPRPSPLLCPRRMFVAALILACKFTQDRVYSNRAWARICGLEPREVSRCERALGHALNWRLWVGKGMKDEPSAFLRQWLLADAENSGLPRPAASATAPLRKCQSLDSALLTPPSSSGSPFASPPESSPPAAPMMTTTAPLTKSVSLDTGIFNAQMIASASQPIYCPLPQAAAPLWPTFPLSSPPESVPSMLNVGHSVAMTPEFGLIGFDQHHPRTRDIFCVSPGSISPSQIIESKPSPPSSQTSSSSSNEYSFIPTTGPGMLSPPASQCSPPNRGQEDSVASVLNANPASHGGFQPFYDGQSTPAANEAGIEGTFDMNVFDDELFASTAAGFN